MTDDTEIDSGSTEESSVRSARKRKPRPPPFLEEPASRFAETEDKELRSALRNSKLIHRMEEALDLPEAPVFHPTAAEVR